MPDITIIEDDYALNNGIALTLKNCNYTTSQITAENCIKWHSKTFPVIKNELQL